MKNLDRIFVAAIAATVGFALVIRAASTPAVAAETYGMRQYVDSKYHFSFWYPKALQVKATSGRDRRSFPGGINVKTLQVGEPGAISVSVVVSPGQTITDEPNGHASPIAQTKYFYDAAASRWMVAFPEGESPFGVGGRATRPADVSETTIGGLPMLPSGARFDATIIPLSTTLFLVVKDGGGSAYTRQLAKTVAPADGRVGAPALSAALKAEADAYGRQ
jgi:hypothetical protein